jgi:hypothetical protein
MGIDMDVSIYAVSFSCLIIGLWSHWDFHTPYSVSEIRYAVPRRRYYFAVIAYATTNIILFFILLVISYTLFRKYGPPNEIRQTAVTAALFLTIVAPIIPGAGAVVDKVREAAHAIALYPQAFRWVTALLARSAFTLEPTARKEMKEELGRYGVSTLDVQPQERSSVSPEGDGKPILSLSADRSLQEVFSIRLRFDRLMTTERIRRYLVCRTAELKEIERDYRHLLRQSARAILLTQDLISERVDETNLSPISDFVAEECESLLTRYRRLIAEASLSCISTTADREKFVRSFGYDVGRTASIPFLPLVLIFAVDFIICLAPIALSKLGINIGDQPSFDMHLAVTIALVHASCQVATVAWAIYPKAVSNFARPSLFSLPWASYGVFGFSSYVTGAIVLGITYSTMSWPPDSPVTQKPLALALVGSIFFFTITVVLSLLVDLRLQRRSYDLGLGRLFDAVVLGAAVAATTLSFQIILFQMILHISRPLEVRLFFISAFGLLGFIIGYFVPAVAAAHLVAKEKVVPDAFGSDLVELLRKKAAPNGRAAQR